MSYIYSKINRLENPHNYMYTSFHGLDLLQSYESSRMEIINRFVNSKYSKFYKDSLLINNFLPVLLEFSLSSSSMHRKKFEILLGDIYLGLSDKNYNKDNELTGLSVDLNKLTVTEPISTLKLLYSLNNIFLEDNHNLNAKKWLDKLIQRFEVTKKIYESYLPGFREGNGNNKLIRLYWLFALTLCLFYIRSEEIKYLSTLLKLNDLLCSLSESDLLDNIPQHGLILVLVTELLSIQSLSNKKEISFAT